MAEDRTGASAGGERRLLLAFSPSQISHSISTGTLQVDQLCLNK